MNRAGIAGIGNTNFHSVTPEVSWKIMFKAASTVHHGIDGSANAVMQTGCDPETISLDFHSKISDLFTSHSRARKKRRYLHE